MVVDHSKGHRSKTGSRYVPFRKRKLMHKGNLPTNTSIGADLLKQFRTKGGDVKLKRAFASYANLTDPKTKKSSKVKITSVVDNPANRNFVRRNIITKGAVVETEKGRAKVTSRPGQDGLVNAVLVK
ncbi:MAG: 30S ribosomal protein S8e [Candidatus Woesearchaeota archaeon]|nr:30S ribosomal protein S8e [Candidatus Woesearchaeota archaeon]